MTERTHFLRGEIDFQSAPEIERRIRRAVALSDGELVIDCYDLTFIDSSGVAVLLGAGAELAATGRSIRITNANETIMRIFELLDVVETLQANYAPSDEPAGPQRSGPPH